MKGKEEDDIDGESGYLIRKQECGDAGGGRKGRTGVRCFSQFGGESLAA